MAGWRRRVAGAQLGRGVAPVAFWALSGAGHRRVGRGRLLLGRLIDAPIELVAPDELTGEAWRLADELGWAKVYDAHYVALARLLGCKLVTLDERLLRGVARLQIAIRPNEV